MKYYSYDPAGEFLIHDDEASAKEAFDEAYRLEEDKLSDRAGDDNISDISWGEIRERLVFTDRAITAEEKETFPEASFIREMSTITEA